MSVALQGKSAARLRTLWLTECAPVALQRACELSGRVGTDCIRGTAAEDLVNVVAGAVLVGSASEVLIPAPLAVALYRHCHGRPAEYCEDWLTMVRDHKVRLLVTPAEASELLKQYPVFRRFCVAVPGGPLVSRLAFCTPVQTFYGETLPSLRNLFAEEAVSRRGAVSWQAWMRSSLTCRYEGLFVPPIRVAEYTAELLSSSPGSDAGGADSVVWEEGSCGLTPRWLETAMKTSMACGVPASALSLALCARAANDPQTLAAKAIDMGVSRFCTCSIRGAELFPGTDSLISLPDVTGLAAGWNQVARDGATGSTRAENDSGDDLDELIGGSDAYAESVTDLFTAWQHSHRPGVSQSMS